MSCKEFDPDGVGVDNGAYFGFPFNTQEAKLVLVSVPWDVTVSYGAGTSNAPDAVIEASTQLDFYDTMAPDAWQRGIATADIDYTLQECSARLRIDAMKVIDHLEGGGCTTDDYVVRKLRRVNEACAQMNNTVYNRVAELLAEGKTVGLVGGDHSTPYGLIRALGERYEDFGILHIDAHCDLREAYEGFEFSHASIMYNVLRDVPRVSHIVQVGMRDYCAAEAVLAASSERITLFDDRTLALAEFAGTPWAEQCRRIVEKLPRQVYVSFDIDGLAIENCPHTGTPVPGGLSFNKAIYLVECVVRSGRQIIGFDVVEVVPHADYPVNAAVGARVLYKLSLLTLISDK